MSEKAAPRIVIRPNGGKVAPASQDFVFTPGQVRLDGVSDYLRQYRQDAWESYSRSTLPNPKDEAWRRTDISKLQPGRFHVLSAEEEAGLAALPSGVVEGWKRAQSAGWLAIAPGRVQGQVDPALTAQGVIFSDLESAEREHASLFERRWGTLVHSSESKFAAMTAALERLGAVLYVPRGVQIDKPLNSFIWGPGAGAAHFSHLLVWLEEDASATLVHEWASPQDEQGEALHGGLVEVYQAPGSTLNFIELQAWGENVWNFTHERAHLERDAHIEWTVAALGSGVTKTFSDLDLVGEGSHGQVSGFYFIGDRQHLDYDTQQNHLAPHTTSNLLYKGALLGSSESIWQGMIYVAPGAIKTDGYQANRNLVLSKDARADSLPGLEILADDVRCSHGATVGKVDREQLFYLMSRGIPEKDAVRLIVEGFFDEIMARIPEETVRGRLHQDIGQRMARAEAEEAFGS
jgi:Fe-S cluster assembly protein SufD